VAIKRITTNLIKDSDIATVDIANNAITAAKITDGNITTAKLADLNVTAGKLAATLDLTGKTITVATATTGDNDTSPASTAFVQQEIAALVDSSPDSLNTLNELAAALGDDASFSTTVTNSIATKLPLAGGTLTGNINFGDSDKAIFGAGSDLQIYHDGSNSYIDEAGDGVLFIKSSAGVYLNGKTTDEALARFMENGPVNLYHDNSLKFNTSSTGIEVTGSAHANTVASTGGTTNNRGMLLAHQNNTNQSYVGRSENGVADTGNRITFDYDNDKMQLDSDGDIVLTPTSNVGIGTTSPAQLLEVSGNAGKSRFTRSGSAGTTMEFYAGASAAGGIQVQSTGLGISGGTGENHVFINTSGKVGIGETDPETSLHIKNSGNSFLTLERSGTTGGTGKFGINMEGGSSQQTTMSYDDGGKLIIGRSSDPATAAGFNSDFILKGGFVGIKTLDPQVELHVTGNANISGSTTTGGVLTANHIVRSDAGHNTARVEAVYDDGAAQYDSNILMWVSEPGYTYDSGGIGVNVHESGHYYGRKYDNDYAVFMRFVKSDGSIQFAQNQGTAGTAGASQVETLKITANGTLRLATTGGIGFGTTNAADTLDDYEEGTYTATISCASGSITLNTSFNALRYTKVGRQVHVHGTLAVSSVSSPTGATYLNLPFTSGSDTKRSGNADNVISGYFNGSAITNGIYTVYGNIPESSSTNRLFVMPGHQNSYATYNLGDNYSAGGTDYYVNFTYTT